MTHPATMTPTGLKRRPMARYTPQDRSERTTPGFSDQERQAIEEAVRQGKVKRVKAGETPA